MIKNKSINKNVNVTKNVKNIKRIVHNIILIVFSILWLFPIYVMVVDGLKSASGVLITPILFPAKSSLGPFITVTTALARPILNSIVYTVPTAIISTYVGAMAAFYFYKKTRVINTLLFTVIAIATFVPYEITLLPLTKFIGSLGLLNTYPGIIIAMLVFYLPTGALLMSIFLAVLPKTTLESARIDGANDWTIFNKVVIPLTMPGFISTFIFILIESWNNFFVPLVLVTTPGMNSASLELMSYTGGYGTLYNESFASAFIASLIPLIIFVFLGRYFIRGFQAFGTGKKG